MANIKEYLSVAFEYFISVGMVIGPILGYIPQYLEIRKTNHTGKFSTIVCFILLTCNSLRIIWYFLVHYQKTLLIQSVVMIMAQIALLELIVRLKRRKLKQEGRGRLLVMKDCIFLMFVKLIISL